MKEEEEKETGFWELVGLGIKVLRQPYSMKIKVLTVLMMLALAALIVLGFMFTVWSTLSTIWSTITFLHSFSLMVN